MMRSKDWIVEGLSSPLARSPMRRWALATAIANVGEPGWERPLPMTRAIAGTCCATPRWLASVRFQREVRTTLAGEGCRGVPRRDAWDLSWFAGGRAGRMAARGMGRGRTIGRRSTPRSSSSSRSSIASAQSEEMELPMGRTFAECDPHEQALEPLQRQLSGLG
jgi:hypothetical protein